MRAVVMRVGRLAVEEISVPRLGPSQILVEPIATGICGSDLSALQHTEDFLQASRDAEMPTYLFDPSAGLVMGHEFSARVTKVGRDVTEHVPGDVIVALPYAVDAAGVTRTVGYSTEYPGGLAEQVVLGGAGHLRVPDGFSPVLAALTEPLTTGTSAVARSGAEPGGGAIVTGCGPVGLGAVAALVERGVEPIVASDPSRARREVAIALGAHHATDPTAGEDPVHAWRDLAPDGQRLTVIEASAARGMLNRLLYSVPAYTRIMIVGSGMLDEAIRPVVGIYKNVVLEFCGGAGPGQDYLAELRHTLERLVSGSIDGRLLITGLAGFGGVNEAFRLLRPTKPDDARHLKILIMPGLAGDGILNPSAVPF
jgi:threonine dehydrogenase-like Zn-dependent dehydrogenase